MTCFHAVIVDIGLPYSIISQGVTKPSIYMLLSFKIQAPLCINGRNGPLEVVMVVDGVKDLCHKRSLLRTDIYNCHSHGVKSDFLQTSNISWLLINLHHHPVRVG